MGRMEAAFPVAPEVVAMMEEYWRDQGFPTPPTVEAYKELRARWEAEEAATRAREADWALRHHCRLCVNLGVLGPSTLFPSPDLRHSHVRLHVHVEAGADAPVSLLAEVGKRAFPEDYECVDVVTQLAVRTQSSLSIQAQPSPTLTPLPTFTQLDPLRSPTRLLDSTSSPSTAVESTSSTSTTAPRVHAFAKKTIPTSTSPLRRAVGKICKRERKERHKIKDVPSGGSEEEEEAAWRPPCPGPVKKRGRGRPKKNPLPPRAASPEVRPSPPLRWTWKGIQVEVQPKTPNSGKKKRLSDPRARVEASPPIDLDIEEEVIEQMKEDKTRQAIESTMRLRRKK